MPFRTEDRGCAQLPALPRHSWRVLTIAAALLIALLPGTAVPAPAWAWPVGPGHAVIRPFIAPVDRYSAGHRGVDIASSVGAIVTAPDDGVVFFAGTVVDRPVLSITHSGGLISSYEPVESPLTVGSVVHRGEVIGTLVAGHCVSACLHFGVRLHGEYVSPLNYLGGIRRSVLLPTRPIVEG
jgi:murein DD-endopeptidase MepM/ murein hydrolase activator NlpD